MPQIKLPPVEPMEKVKPVTQSGKILALIKRPGGALNWELSRVALQYHARIFYLRQDGHNIIAERQYLKNGRASNTFRYRMGGQ